MEGAHRRSERRRHRRVEIHAQAEVIVAEGQWMGVYDVENLSAGGGFFVGNPGIDVGERIAIRLHLPGAERPVGLVAEVLRVEIRDREHHGLATAFREISADVEDLIHAAVLAALERPVTTAVA